MAKTTKIKAAATLPACQSKTQVQDFIRTIGDKTRELARLETTMNDEIAEITNDYAEKINPLKLEIEQLTGAVQIWCEANRIKLLEKGLKTANLITGEVSWRIRPPSVNIRGKEAVIEKLKSLGLTQFIRTKEEPNKEAILEDATAVKDVKGITIVSGVEDFIINPFEVDVA